MAKRRRTAELKGSEIINERWKLYLVMVIISVVIVAGFFLSGKQHFSSWDFSIRNSKLRKQIDELETEKRRLILAREVANSPNELKRAVSRLMPAKAAPAAVPALAVKTPDKNVDLAVAKKGNDRNEPYSIVKTAMVMPTKNVAKAEKPVRTIAKNLAE